MTNMNNPAAVWYPDPQNALQQLEVNCSDGRDR